MTLENYCMSFTLDLSVCASNNRQKTTGLPHFKLGLFLPKHLPLTHLSLLPNISFTNPLDLLDAKVPPTTRGCPQEAEQFSFYMKVCGTSRCQSVAEKER